MAGRQSTWSSGKPRPAPLAGPEKDRIIAACEGFIRDVLKPRFLPAIRPTEFNYCVDIFGKWAGGRYRFIQLYRSGFVENLGDEFEAPFARLDYMGPGRFDIQWMRHTGKWWPLYAGLSLSRALAALESDELLHPI
ncbi:hypothetical protein [Phreatobacter stygius]|uniref:Uncharacterized protein n=1 Tax=Phreatobacter stygius TaxID=1940610 RepID=A0A4D7BAY4_9HYPH|nr:hypothetical protein [Phreatobacter stygius]QCI65272.1 hypothetical protein E8M01_14270 [Phreatobacter stygius]